MSDDQLDPLSRALIDTTRDDHDPGPGDYERVRAKVVRRMGMAAFVATTVTAMSTWAKVAIVVSTLAVVAGGATYASTRRDRVETSPSASSVASPVAVAVAPAATGAPIPARSEISPAPDPTPEPPPSEIVPPTTVSVAASAVPRVHATATVASATPKTPRSSLADETALLVDANGALRSHDPTRALAMLDEHAARFPNGALSEERDATRIIALCEAGRTTQAKNEATRFLTARPKSPSVSRVRASCAGTP